MAEWLPGRCRASGRDSGGPGQRSGRARSGEAVEGAHGCVLLSRCGDRADGSGLPAPSRRRPHGGSALLAMVLGTGRRRSHLAATRVLPLPCSGGCLVRSSPSSHVVRLDGSGISRKRYRFRPDCCGRVSGGSSSIRDGPRSVGLLRRRQRGSAAAGAAPCHLEHRVEDRTDGFKRRVRIHETEPHQAFSLPSRRKDEGLLLSQ